MQFSLTQFLGVLDIRDASGRPYVIIGGQAVNYWAETFLQTEPELAAHLPFVSRDIDFLGGRDDVLKAARKLGFEAQLPHPKLMTAFAGAVVFKIGEIRTNLEFVRKVPRVSAAEISKWAVSSEHGGRAIRVLDPVSLLACKLNLALTVDQTGRRDLEHVRILIICVRAFLRETLRGVESGELPARGWLGAVERVLTLTESNTGRRAARKLGVDCHLVLPEADLAASTHRVAIQLREKRLPQWRAKLERRAAKR